MSMTPHRITIVQYAGDFREAALRLSEGGAETYRAQQYTVDYVEALAARCESVTTVTGFTTESYDATLPSGARAIGAGFTSTWNAGVIADLIGRTSPTHIVLRTPNIALLRRIVGMRVPTLAMLADSFPNRSWKERLKRYLTVHYLNAPSIQRIGNHGRNATAQLITAGVDKHKVFAWDYPSLDTPEKRPPKTGPAGQHLIYVGMVSASKGVDDLIKGLALARRTLPRLTLDIIGQGETDRLQKLVSELNLKGVNFVGPAPNNTIVQRMADADAVVIPSRHDYSEGLPLTIYEAFCSRTPLILSDHPMFLENVTDGQSGLMFKGSDPVGLSAAIVRLFQDPQLYEALSTNSLQAWGRLQISQTWADAIDQWLRGDVIAKG